MKCCAKVAGYFEESQVRLSSLTSLRTNFSRKKVRSLVNQKVSFMETTFVRLESLTYDETITVASSVYLLLRPTGLHDLKLSKRESIFKSCKQFRRMVCLPPSSHAGLLSMIRKNRKELTIGDRLMKEGRI